MRKSTKCATKKTPKGGEIYRREKVDARNKAKLNRCNTFGTEKVIICRHPLTVIHVPVGLTWKERLKHIDRYNKRFITI